MLDEQLSGASKMLVVNSSHQKPTTRQIGLQASTCDEHSLLIDFSNSRLQSKNGFHFYNGEARDKMLGIRL